MIRILGTLFALALLSSVVFAKDPVVGPPANNGTELFRGMFHYHGVKPITRENLDDYRNLIVVVMGRTDHIADSFVVEQTLKAGGAVLLMGDTPWNLSEFFPNREKIRITGAKVKSKSNLGGQASVPLISGKDLVLPGSEIPANLRIATNMPSVIQIGTRPRFLRDITIRFPRDSHTEENNELGLSDFFAAAGEGDTNDPYRCFVVANTEIFSNRMMYTSLSTFDGGVTPDNFRYANETVKWLIGPTKREYCLFIENGVIKDKLDDFDYRSLPSKLPDDLPIPPIPDPLERPVQAALANIIDSTVADAEDRNSFNRLITGNSNNDRRYAGLLIALTAIVLNFFAVRFIRRLWFSGHKAKFQPLPTDPLYLGENAPVGSYEHRRLELMRGNDFREPFTQYVLRMFTERGLPEGYNGRTMPELEITTRKQGELKGMIRELWREAHVHTRHQLPYTRWKELEPVLTAVRSAADADLWKFRPMSS